MNTRFGLSLFLAGVPLLFSDGPKDNILAVSPTRVSLMSKGVFPRRGLVSPKAGIAREKPKKSFPFEGVLVMLPRDPVGTQPGTFIMKTKLTLFVTVLAVALFGMGCASTSETAPPLVKIEPAFVKEGLVAYYPFNGNAKDESGNGNDGEVKGAKLAEDRNGELGKAYSLDGNSLIQVSDSDNLRPSHITITGWLKTDKGGTIVSKSNRADASAEQYYLSYDSRFGGQPKLNFSIKRNSGGRAGHNWQRALSDGAVNDSIKGKGWVMLSATWDGEVQIVYLDGFESAKNTDAPQGGIDNIKGGSLSIGRHWDQDPMAFTGSLDDVRIYNRAVSAKEVKALYDLEKPKGK